MPMSRYATILAALLLLLSTASAQRWKQVTLPAPYQGAYYLDIFFLPGNDQKGWACDMDSGYVVRTIDGGQTWTGSRAGPAGQRTHLEYIQFFANQTGYTCGPGGLFKSINDGATWSQITIPDTILQIWGAWFKTANEGWITGGGCGYNAFLHTTDGGATFEVFVDTTVKRSNMADPLWQSDMPAGTVYASGNGTLWKTTNSGTSWAVEANTGPTHPWQEEITRFGTTFMVSCATSNCTPGDYAGGGVRYSADNGQTWNEFNIGEAMYGVHLLDGRTAWAAGTNANVWYTENGGQDWELRNCGLNGADMDDITFITPTNGWVSGKGIFRLAPPLRRVEPDDLSFTEICTGTGIVDTIWVHNINFHNSPWESKFIGEYEYLYRIMNPLPDPLPACDSVAILIEYRGSGPGTRRAQLEIKIYDPDTTLYVNLAGTSRDLTAAPDKDLLQYNVRVGSNGDRVIYWRSDSLPQEVIEAVVRDSGDTNIVYNVPLPQPISIAPGITSTIVSANPQDTGWIEAVFRVTTSPCARDTHITVRVYGESPIINAPDVVSVDVACNPDGRLRVPISNTGNLPLIISAARLTGADATAFSIVGFTSGNPGPPWSIPVGGSDTLVLNYTPTTGNESANLVLENDDYTTTRGIVRPWTVVLTASANGPTFAATPDVIDLGTICLSDVKDTLFRLANQGDGSISARAVPSGSHVTGLSGSFVSISPQSDRVFRFQWRGPRTGLVTDTIRVDVAPCDTSTVVIITANVVDETIVVSPDPVVDSTYVGGSVERQITLTARTSSSITITAIDVLPATADVVVALPGLPLTLADGEQGVVTITWTPTTEGPVALRLDVTASSVCPIDVGTDIRLHTITGELDVSRSLLEFNITCTPRLVQDTVFVVSSAPTAVTLRTPVIIQTGTPFTLISPTTPTTLDPSVSYPIVVQYNPATASPATAVLRLTTDPTGSSVDVELAGSFQEPVLSGDTTLDFGIRGACEDPLVSIVPVQNSGTMLETVFVDATTIPAGFQVSPMTFDLAPGAQQDVTITCTPAVLSPGRTSGAIVMTGGYCFDRVVAAVSVQANKSQLLMTPSPVNAGTVLIGESVRRTVTISNPGTEARTIVSLTVDPASSAWRIVTDPAGIVVDAGNPTTVDVIFEPNALGSDAAQLVLVDMRNCPATSRVNLQGTAVDAPAHRLDVRVDRYLVSPYDMVEIPVWFDSDIRAAKPTSIHVTLTHSQLMFKIEEITTTYPDARITTQWSPETVTIDAVGTGPLFGISGPVAVMRGRAYPAIPDSTAIDIISVDVEAEESVSWREQDGLLRVLMCGPYNAIDFIRPTTVQLGAPHPVRDVLELRVVAPAAQSCEIDIVDAAGQTVFANITALLPVGESAVTVPVDHVSSGTYIVRVRTSHGGIFTMPIVILR